MNLELRAALDSVRNYLSPTDSVVRVRVTLLVLTANSAVYIAMARHGVFPDPSYAELLRWGAIDAPSVSGGDWWRLWTSNFVHVSLSHFFDNMLRFLFAGIYLEQRIGSLHFFFVYVACALTASLASIIGAPYEAGAGASGSVLGVCASLVVVAVMSRKGSRSRPWGLGVVALLAFALIVYGAYLDIWRARPAGVEAHFGGILAGLLAGVLVALLERYPSRTGSIVLGLISVAPLVVAVQLIPRGVPGIEYIYAVQRQVIRSFNRDQRLAMHGQISPAEFVDRLDRNVLAPWRPILDGVNAMDRITVDCNLGQSRLHRRLVPFVRLRYEGWLLFRQVGLGADESVLERARQKHAEAQALLNASNREAKAVQPP